MRVQKGDTIGWKHNIEIETIETDEAQFNMWSVSKVLPIHFDSTVFVLLRFDEEYMGGAHGMYSTTTYNFEVETGELLQLSDIVDDNSTEFKKLLKTKVEKEYEYDFDFGKDIFTSFMIHPAGIELTFPPYSLSGGFWEKNIFLSYGELQNVLVRELYPDGKE